MFKVKKDLMKFFCNVAGSEAEEGDDFASEPEDSNDSWSTQEELSTDLNFR